MRKKKLIKLKLRIEMHYCVCIIWCTVLYMYLIHKAWSKLTIHSPSLSRKIPLRLFPNVSRTMSVD